MPHINLLSMDVANLIAAGEVVDRPASAVKELCENAIDAGATAITVEIKRGGSAFMRITDNGCGMERDELPIAIKRHATSKIKNAADLNAIGTLGFRGEALAAIAAVSKLRIMSKPRTSENGGLLCAEGGNVTELCDAGCADGTTIIAEELFANVPARRKFLKKDASEALAVAAVVEKLALSHPEIAVRFISDGVLRFNTEGDGKLFNVIYTVLGRDFAQRMLEISFKTAGVNVNGFVGRPDNVRANRNFQNFFINSRYVRCRTASAALEQAFDSYIPSEKFPCCVLSLDILPAFVDVNVHPAKLEVKFSNDRLVFDAVYCAVRNALVERIDRPALTVEPTRKTADDIKTLNAFVPIYDRMNEDTDGDPKPPETLADTVREIKDQPPVDIPPRASAYGGAPTAAPARHTETAKNAPAKLNFLPSNAVLSSEDIARQSGEKAAPDEAPDEASEESGVSESIKPDAFSFENDLLCAENLPDAANDTKSDTLAPAKADAACEYTAETPAEIPTGGDHITDARPAAHTNADGRAVVALPEYFIIGEAFNSYVFVETGERILCIDKHAAHERIIFEQMKRNMQKSERVSQIVLLPITLDLSAQEFSALGEYHDEICSCGFRFVTDDKKRTADIIEYPAELEQSEAAALFCELITRLSDGTSSVRVTREIVYEKALYQASCKAAIKAGRVYTPEHVKWIVEQLLMLPDIKFCPHGRPVAFEMTKHELEKQFKRI